MVREYIYEAPWERDEPNVCSELVSHGYAPEPELGDGAQMISDAEIDAFVLQESEWRPPTPPPGGEMPCLHDEGRFTELHGLCDLCSQDSNGFLFACEGCGVRLCLLCRGHLRTVLEEDIAATRAT